MCYRCYVRRGYDGAILHWLDYINRVLLFGSAAEPRFTQCRIVCDEHLLSYQYDLEVNMWKIRVHTRDCQMGFYLTPTFKTEEEAVAYAARTDVAWRYNAYCTYEQIGG